MLLFARVRASADETSAVEFDGRGEYLVAGDNAGRVILFRRTDDGDDVSVLTFPVLINPCFFAATGHGVTAD